MSTARREGRSCGAGGTGFAALASPASVEASVGDLTPASVRASVSRRRAHAVVLATIPMVAIWVIRSPIESGWLLGLEAATILLSAGGLAVAGLSVAGGAAAAVGGRSGRRWRPAWATGLMLASPLAAMASRWVGTPVATEMAIVSTFGSFAVLLAVGSDRSRNLSMSIVASGFLALFTISISDDPRSAGLGVLWIAICLWHLITGHWDRLDVCMPETVRRGRSVRPLTLLLGLAFVLLGGVAVQGRFGEASRFRFGMMPTSGGDEWSDPGARSGVGGGDAVIAAERHAETFGPVESEIFLESTEMSLFDLFSDMLGDTPKKNRSEKAQSLQPDEFLQSHADRSESHRGGRSFSSRRNRPRERVDLADVVGDDVVQWIGPTGIRLAMERYDRFDGVDWTRSTERSRAMLSPRKVEGRTWYFDPASGALESGSDYVSGVLKVIRLDSIRVPAPMLTAAVHIRDVERADFFGTEPDGSLSMPGRSKIPPLTVIRMVANRPAEDELLRPAAFAGRSLSESSPASGATAGIDEARRLASRWGGDGGSRYERLMRIVSRLRTEFTFDRDTETLSDDPLDVFLKRRRGGDHLFATAAAVMGQAIGMETRLVTGFYVPQSGFDVVQGHAGIGPEDVHVWVEARMADGRWIEIEPTPGYASPNYRPSLWLRAKRFAAAWWPIPVVAGALLILLVRTRVIWVEVWLRLMWGLSRPFAARSRLRLLLWLLECRARLARVPRSEGITQRDWMLSVAGIDGAVADRCRDFCDAADRLVFGGGTVAEPGGWRAAADYLVTHMTTQFFRSAGRPTESGSVE